jgi:glycosyltransferase involved in cell wall biosynthesis
VVGPLGRDGYSVSAWWPDAPPPVVDPSVLPRQPQAARTKVLHVITRFSDGSGGNTLVTLLGTDPTRFENWLVSSPGGPLWERAARHGVTTVQLRRLREVIAPLDDFIVLLQLVRLIRRERFSIVHTHSAKAGFLGRLAAWLCRTPVVIHTIHGFSWHDFMGRPRRRAYIALERLVGRMTDLFFAVAPQIAREAVELRVARPGSVVVVPSAIELDAIPEQPDARLRDELGIPHGVAIVGTVGRFDFQKAPLDWVRMAALVVASHPETRFVMVGEGPLLDAARGEARRLGVDIVFTGFRHDAAVLASCFDVFVISSLYEGLGRALSEALASGRPVVASAVNGVTDIVRPGATGLLAPPGDHEALARNVIWMLEHPHEAGRMGDAGRAHARALFAPAVMSGAIVQAYERLLGLPGLVAPSPAHVADQSLSSAGERERVP